MKTLTLCLLLYYSTLTAQFIDRDYTQASFWVDPVAWHKEGGPQIGLEITKVMRWGWVSASLSHFEALEPDYTDAVGSGGINFHLFGYDPVRYYAGIRLGFLWRAGNPYPLAGSVMGFDWKIIGDLSLGLRAWIDYREDQKNQFYGDSDGYEPGLITNNPLLQENGAIVVTIKF